MIYITSPVLNDAYQCLNQCKGLPNIVSAAPLRQRQFRACILFSWIAVEEMLNYSARDLLKRRKLEEAPRGKLSTQITEILQIRGFAPLDPIKFREMRRARNSLAHPVITDSDFLLKYDEVRAVFDYCLSLTKSLSPYELKLG